MLILVEANRLAPAKVSWRQSRVSSAILESRGHGGLGCLSAQRKEGVSARLIESTRIKIGWLESHETSLHYCDLFVQ